jgi:hypothetical protein
MVRTLGAIILSIGFGLVGCKPPAGAIASTTAAASTADGTTAPASADARPKAQSPAPVRSMTESCRRCLDDAAQQAQGEDGGTIDVDKAVLYRGPNSCELAVPLKGRDAADGLQYGGDCPCDCADSFVTKPSEERG